MGPVYTFVFIFFCPFIQAKYNLVKSYNCAIFYDTLFWNLRLPASCALREQKECQAKVDIYQVSAPFTKLQKLQENVQSISFIAAALILVITR